MIDAHRERVKEPAPDETMESKAEECSEARSALARALKITWTKASVSSRRLVYTAAPVVLCIFERIILGFSGTCGMPPRIESESKKRLSA